VAGVSKTSKRPESIFQENPEIRQMFYYLRLVPRHGQPSGTFYTNPFFL
jgi:hypothetical protein